MSRMIDRELNLQSMDLSKIFEVIINSEFDEVTITDQNGVFISVFKTCNNNFGIDKNKMLGKSAYDLEKDGVFSKSVTLRVLKEKKKISLVQETAAGKRLLVTGMPCFNSSGNLMGVINVSRDITEYESLRQRIGEIEGILKWYKKEFQKRQILKENFFIGESRKMETTINLINRVADTDATVILTGETGVGKSFFARSIHQLSNHRDKPFVQINCSAIPETLMESELFGYEEGSFTGASRKGKKGLFEIAQNGTIFLDEIAEIPLHLQAKLLNVLQEKRFYKIGGTKAFEVQARIISATNKNLMELVREGRFREDLYFRLNVIPIHIPSLKERIEDIPNFVYYFLEKFNKKYDVHKQITAEVYHMLINYSWPGNIRELENTLERLVITSNGELIDKTNLFLPIKAEQTADTIFSLDTVIPLKQALEQLEEKLLTKAMGQCKTTRNAAKILEIDQSTVVKKLKKYHKTVVL